MVAIQRLEIHQFRNLTAVDIALTPHFNLFYGNNGSGKTSLLEAIHYLATGRSLRTAHAQHLIQHHTEKFSIFADMHHHDTRIPLGVERHGSGERTLRLAGENQTHWRDAAKQLPVRMLGVMTHRFLLEGPKIRRQFLDWLLFHVEPTFFHPWQQLQQILKQRNAALKTRLPLEQVRYWDSAFLQYAVIVDEWRRRITTALQPIFRNLLAQLLPECAITLHYYPGWDDTQPLESRLRANLMRDFQYGYTVLGPHRGDLRLLLDNLPAADILSQGQQKIVTYALHLAQGILFREKTNTAPLYLIDDLSAELDHEKSKRVRDILQTLGSQILVTGIAASEFKPNYWPKDAAVFHVEHGVIAPA